MAIKFSQFNLRTDHTSGMYLVGYDGNQNIHITVDNLFDDFINGTENTIAMFGTNGTVLADSIITQSGSSIGVAGAMTVTSDATFSTNIEVEGTADFNGDVNLGDEAGDLITQNGTLYLNGPVKDTTDTLGAVDQVLLSDATGELTFTDLADLHVGGAEVVEVPVKNVQGSALVKGDPVYISGSVGASGRLEVQLADASNTLKMPAVGLLKQDLADQAEGFAVVTGKLRNLITDPIDGVTPTENDVIYVKPSGTSGAALTTTKPVYGNFIQNIGKVGRVSTSNDGNLVVSSILRTNDIPNLTPGRLWIGSTGNTIESQTLFVDEANSEVGIGTTDPYAELHIKNTVDNPGLMIESEQATGGNFQNSYINLRAAQTSNNTLANATIALHGVNSVNSAGAKTLVIRNQTLGGGDVLISALDSSSSATNPARFKSSGQVQFEEYGSGSFTGTIAKNLSIDSSGNIIETNPAVDGSGTLNYVTKWTPDGNTLGDSIIYDNGTQVAVGTIYPAASVKLHVEGHFRVNDGNINITRSSLPTLYLSTSSTSTDDYALQNSGGHFQIKNVAGLGDIQFQIRNGGQIKFDNYGQNTFTGTAAKNLSVDASGNVIETDAYNWDISDGTNSETIVSGDTVTFSGGTDLTTTYAAGTNTLTIDHDTISRGNSNATRTPGYGGTFTAVDNIVTNATGHVTGVNLLTVTLPSEEDYTWTLTADSGTDQTINKNDTVDIAGGTNITTSVGATDTVTIDLDDSVTLAGELTVNGTGQSSFAGQVTIPQTPSAGTDAASKHYVDQAVTGALSYQGGYNAATNTPDLDSSPSSSIKKGWTYTVTADGLFFTEQVRVGDVIIAEVDAPTTLANWTTVQNNIDLADASTVGIGNVAGGTGIGVSYSNGTATVSQDAVTLNQNTSSATPGSGGSFTAIDSVTTDSTGHLTDFNLKTVTLPTATVSGSGTANYVSKWNTTNALTDSLIYDTGTQLGIATTSPDSGVILQIGDGTVSEKVRIYDSSNKYIDLFGSGIHFTRNNSYLRPAGAAASQTLYIGDNLGGSNPNRSWGAIRSNFNDFWFTDNGVKVMRIHNENVGIGTGAVYPNSASEKLHVDGNFRLTGSFKDGSNGAGTSGQVLSSTGTSTSWISLPATYTDADVDAHLNTSTATTNQVLSWTGTDYDWVTSSASNDYVNAASFNTGDGILTLTRTDTGTVTVDLDGRFITASSTDTLTNKSGNISQWTNDSGYITSSSLPTVNNGTLTLSTSAGLDGSASFTANQSGNSAFTVSLDLSELTDMTGAVDTAVDEIILLDNGAERRKRFDEIFGSNAYNSTTIPTNNNQLTNGAGYITSFTNNYLNNITKSGNTLTFSVSGTTNQSYTFGSNAFNSTTIPTNNNQLANGAGYITSASLPTDFVSKANGGTFAGNVTIDDGTSSTLWVKCDDGGNAIVRASGEGQGTGVLEVGQSTSYGGGISYNGDGSPAWASGETADYITFYRMENGSRTEVFNYPYNSNTVTFNGDINVNGGDIVLGGTGRIQGIDTVSSGTDAVNKTYVDNHNWAASDITSGTFAPARIAHNSFDIGDTTAETGRSVHETGIYTFNRNNGTLGTGTEAAYYSVLAWGQGAGGSAQIAAKWTGGGDKLYFRSLRDTTDNWWDWKEIYHTSHKPTYSELGTMAYSNLTGAPTIPTNNNQLTNGAGYITGYTETDTLSTVLGRGNTTSTGAEFYSKGTIAKLSSSSAGSHSDGFIVGCASYQNKSAMYLHGEANIGTAQIEYGYNNTGLTMRATSNGTFYAVSFRDGINGQRGSIRVSTSSTTYNTTSDYRLKENVIEITDGIERVKQLQPKRFNFISEPEATVDGFIAHEAQEVVPESVTGEKDGMHEVLVTPAEYDDEGNLITEAVMGVEEDYQGIDNSKLVPLLTAALKEAIAKIEDLEARVVALEP